MLDKDLGTPIDGIVASELRDSQGESLSVVGADISELEAGRGYWNSDHRNAFPDVVGRITKAKKIFTESDCEDDRQRHYWQKVKSPFIYAAGYVFDKDGEHRAAQAVAAILRNQSRADSPLKLKASVEGGVLERGKEDPRTLKRTKITKVALTFSPSNAGTLIESPRLMKSAAPSSDRELLESLIPMARLEVPTFIEAPEYKIRTKFEKINSLMKALIAGYGGGTPISATGGQVLQTESLDSGKSFRYIDCEHCGKEQPYLKYQVKCRNCGKSFAFDSLAKFFLSKAKAKVSKEP
jgi:ribosomal protein S27E